MTDSRSLEDARAQLNLVLSFFPRAEAKLSVLLGVDLAMLGTLASTLPPIGAWESSVVAALLAAACLGVSVVDLYRAALPSLEGTGHSLIYFREIAQRTELDYSKLYTSADVEGLIDDILSQTWRNSAILAKKFDCLDSSFRWTALAVLPWIAWLAFRAVL